MSLQRLSSHNLALNPHSKPECIWHQIKQSIQCRQAKVTFYYVYLLKKVLFIIITQVSFNLAPTTTPAIHQQPFILGLSITQQENWQRQDEKRTTFFPAFRLGWMFFSVSALSKATEKDPFHGVNTFSEDYSSARNIFCFRQSIYFLRIWINMCEWREWRQLQNQIVK